MKPELKEKWIAALEGPYADKKGENYLCTKKGEMCCLGVLGHIEGDLSSVAAREKHSGVLGYYFLKNNRDTQYLPEGKYDLPSWAVSDLMEINDEADTFAPVIEYIRENL